MQQLPSCWIIWASATWMRSRQQEAAAAEAGGPAPLLLVLHRPPARWRGCTRRCWLSCTAPSPLNPCATQWWRQMAPATSGRPCKVCRGWGSFWGIHAGRPCHRGKPMLVCPYVSWLPGLPIPSPLASDHMASPECLLTFCHLSPPPLYSLDRPAAGGRAGAHLPAHGRPTGQPEPEREPHRPHAGRQPAGRGPAAAMSAAPAASAARRALSNCV